MTNAMVLAASTTRFFNASEGLRHQIDIRRHRVNATAYKILKSVSEKATRFSASFDPTRQLFKVDTHELGVSDAIEAIRRSLTRQALLLEHLRLLGEAPIVNATKPFSVHVEGSVQSGVEGALGISPSPRIELWKERPPEFKLDVKLIGRLRPNNQLIWTGEIYFGKTTAPEVSPLVTAVSSFFGAYPFAAVGSLGNKGFVFGSSEQAKVLFLWSNRLTTQSIRDEASRQQRDYRNEGTSCTTFVNPKDLT